MEKLRAQKEYLEAEENGDLEKMRQIAIKFGSSLGKSSRDTPVPCKNRSPGCPSAYAESVGGFHKNKQTKKNHSCALSFYTVGYVRKKKGCLNCLELYFN